MRIRFIKNYAFFIVFINIIIVYYTLKLFQTLVPSKSGYFEEAPVSTKSPYKHITKQITVVINDFDLQDNDVTGTVLSFLKVFPNVQILIFTSGVPYPPLQLGFLNGTFRNVKLLNLTPSLDVPFMNNPLSYIKTYYVLFVPDSTRILHRQPVQQMMNAVIKEPDVMFAVPYSKSKNLTCLEVEMRLNEWTLKFRKYEKNLCDNVIGKHAILVRLSTLYQLSNPFMAPFPQSLYLQTAYHKFKIKVLNNIQFQDGKPLFHSHHAQRSKSKSDLGKFKKLYETYSIKQVIRENGVIENYGCTRDNVRCFGSVINYTPSYFYENKTIPPCCLANLRKTAKHVFNSLQTAGIRFWLDGGSLIGAMRNGDIIDTDYDVDVSFNRDDLNRCVWLRQAKNKPTFDTKGFLWERATEGNFYRVYYSKINRIYVNLFPFYLKNGTMVKDAWVTSLKSMEFPEHFMHPMSSIEFIGKQVPSPNNIRDYLELKYDKGVIENNKYPDFKSKFT